MGESSLLLPFTSYIAAAAIVILAAVVQTTTGMGFGLFSAPLLALVDVALVPVSVLTLGLATAALAARQERFAIRWDEVAVALVGRLLGAAAAAVLLTVLTDKNAFAAVFAIFILLAVALSIAGLSLPLTRKTLVAMATLSGLTGTITSVGAPPMALIYQSVPAHHARPTLSAFFALGAAISLLLLALAGHLEPKALIAALVLAPAMLLGFRLSPRVRKWVDRRFRWIALGLATAAAVKLLTDALL